jgi:hypothetical protein
VPETAEDPQSPLTILLWSLFLGMSWTWCIGMFLPVILVREFGLAGWIVFAIPNVLGAAAMGWVLRTRESSIRLVQNHRLACLTFSYVTVAFHLFFIGWFAADRLVPDDNVYWMLWALIFAFLLLSARLPGDLWSAAATFIVSTLAIAFALYRGSADKLPSASRAAGAITGAAYLTPVCAFGFLLCPYLDLTFHRARQQTSGKQARLVFSLGFGLFFFLMIVFSLWYAPHLAVTISAPGALPEAFAIAIIVHMLVQSAFTVSLHVRHLNDTSWHVPLRHLLLWVLLAGGPLLLRAWVQTLKHWLSLDAGELIYRCFMGFYALVFPAYVYLCIIPDRGDSPPTRRHLLVFACSVLIALPMFWVGFIHQRLIWLLPGLLVVLLARLAIPRRARSS